MRVEIGNKDLFKKFPSGVGIITTKKLSKYKNRTSEISLYDHGSSNQLKFGLFVC